MFFAPLFLDLPHDAPHVERRKTVGTGALRHSAPQSPLFNLITRGKFFIYLGYWVFFFPCIIYEGYGRGLEKAVFLWFEIN